MVSIIRWDARVVMSIHDSWADGPFPYLNGPARKGRNKVGVVRTNQH